MKQEGLYKILNIVTIFVVTMFFSCSDSFDQVQKIGISENEPIGIAENINLKHTDSGRVTANIIKDAVLIGTYREYPDYLKLI